MPSFTYSHNPSAIASDELRLMLGDTDSTQPFLYDDEIAYCLGKYPASMLKAALQGCDLILAKLARYRSETVGGVTINLTEVRQGYRDLKKDLEARLVITGAVPYAGGVSRSDNESVRCDPDVPRPQFTTRMFEIKRTDPIHREGSDD